MMDLPRDVGVLYINVGYKHLNHLVVSLLSLRDHYAGPVAILTPHNDESAEFLERFVASEKRVQPLQLISFELTRHRRGSVYNAKTSMGDLSPFERTVFLDADTLVVNDFSALVPAEDREHVHFTQFANWTTHRKAIRGRITKWEKVLPHQVYLQQQHAIPAINTGVLGFSKLSKPFMDRWREDTAKRVGFICDEVCAQLLYPEYPHLLLDERWNCSPRHSTERHGPHLLNHDARVLHGHGKKFLKCKPHIQETWWLPYYRRALASNFCHIAEWTDDPDYRLMIRPRAYLSAAQWEALSVHLKEPAIGGTT